jgi:hypothetical protein
MNQASRSLKNVTGTNLFMQLNAGVEENLEFPNNIFENMNISPKYAQNNASTGKRGTLQIGVPNKVRGKQN